MLGLVFFLISIVLFLLKLRHHFDAVQKEFFNPVRVNFVIGAPLLAAMVLILSEPIVIAKGFHPGTQVTKGTFVFMALCQLVLNLYLYGRWWAGTGRSFSIANPTYQIPIVGNFLLGIIGGGVSDQSWKHAIREIDLFFFSIGLLYITAIVLFCFHNMPHVKIGGESFFHPKNHNLHYSLFLFMAPPAIASISWQKITGEYAEGSKIALSISFFFVLLCLRFLPLFFGKLGISSWACTFPGMKFDVSC
jgi:hypothetical protein